MNSKISKFNHIKNFIYAPKLEDLHIFSRQYLNSILKPYYSSNTDKDNYASICIDFNKLHDINATYGCQVGDKIIHYSLSLIQSILPPDTIYARIGGDEFVFLINNCPPDRIDHFINNIHSVLKDHEKELLFSSVTAYGVHSTENTNLSEMINEADLKITEEKNNFNQASSYSKWGILEKKLTQNLMSFFKSLRLYKQEIDNSFLRKLYIQAISSCSNLLEKDFSKEECDFEEQNSTFLINESELDKLYSIFLKENPSEEEINSIDTNAYSDLLDNLIHDPVSGNFSKDYFVNYLLNDENEKYKVKYISSSYIKLYNTVFSHAATDIKSNEMVNDLLKYLQEELDITFAKESFSDKSQNYFIALGAGDYLLAIPEDIDVNNDRINDYFVSESKDMSDLKNILTLFCSQDFHTITKDNCDILLSDLCKECKELKDVYKISTLEENSIKDALSNIIYDSATYYMDNIPHNTDINNKSKFLQLLAKTMLDISVNLNKTQNKTKER